MAVDVELDRRRAIDRAIGGAGPEDVIVVAGRGHETELLIGPARLHFSDIDVEHLEVEASHLGLGFSPAVFQIIAERLAAPEQRQPASPVR